MSEKTIEIIEQPTVLEVSISETNITVEPKVVNLLEIQELVTQLEIKDQQVTEIDIENTKTEVIEVVIEGPRGPQGAAGTEIEVEAAENISALRIVRALNASQVVKADSTMTFTEARCLGMATEAITTGNTGLVKFFGAIEDASFTYTAGTPLFLTQDGQISDVQDPLSVYNSTIGHGLGAGAIFIDLQEPIEL